LALSEGANKKTATSDFDRSRGGNLQAAIFERNDRISRATLSLAHVGLGIVRLEELLGSSQQSQARSLRRVDGAGRITRLERRMTMLATHAPTQVLNSHMETSPARRTFLHEVRRCHEANLLLSLTSETLTDRRFG
jgi:hypothetical protein